MNILLFTLLLFTFGISQAQRSAEKSKRHYIFYVHGIGGSVASFGAMPGALKNHLDAARPDTLHESYSFVYPTADKKMTTDDFAILFGQYIDKKLKGRLQPQDKISVISHSQGGIVSLIWYFHAYRQLHHYANRIGVVDGVPQYAIDYHPEYVKNLDAFISLGTPYWGSKLATFLTNDNFISKQISSTLFTNLGRRQLDEMALMSETNSKFRKHVTVVPTNILEHMGKSIRPLAIAGVADVVEIFRDKTYGLSENLKIFKGMAFGSRYWESDGAVPLPAARFDAIYTVDRSTNYAHGQVTPRGSTRETNFSPLLIVNALHASPVASIPDIVEVPQSCITSLDCKHPSFKYVYQHLIGEALPEHGADVPANALGGFMMSVRVNFPQGIDLKKKKVEIRLMNAQEFPDYSFVLANSNELFSSAEYINPLQRNIYFRTIAGHFKYKDDMSSAAFEARKNGAKAFFLIQSPGYKSRYIETTLKPTYSTFIEVNLEPMTKEVNP